MSTPQPNTPPQSQWIPVVIALIGALSAVGVAWVSSPSVARSAALGAVNTAAKDEVARQLQLPVGTIIASILPPLEFSKSTGGGGASTSATVWAPCEGQRVDSMPYQQTTGLVTVPDLRGLFLRGLSVFSHGMPEAPDLQRDTTDPEGKREPGKGQPDMLGLQITNVLPNNLELLNYEGGGGNGQYGLKPVDPRQANVRAGKETAPRNAAVYYYCKIN